jgi:cytochrome oxidase assembly protein ShyY1
MAVEQSSAAAPRSRWVTATAFALIVSVSCLFLARWQWHRLHQREAINAVIIANYNRPPVRLDSLLQAGEPLAPNELWRQVVVTGRYDTSQEVLVRKRAYNEATGYWVMTPLRSTSGVVWCVRGWIPAGSDARTPSTVPPPPPGTVIVTGHLRVPEGASNNAGLPTGQVQRIDIDALASGTSEPTYRAWLQVTDERPSANPSPVRLVPPEVSNGPHLGYVIQWCMFAAGAWIGLWVILRRSRELDEEDAWT